MRTGTRDYLRGALWVYPSVAVVVALAAGSVLSRITLPAGSWLNPLLFQGTAGDARSLLLGISGTMITVIALVLGLTLVALQLASTQYSPRLLRSFLRDRPNQLALSVFVATFVYSTAGLYTVGVHHQLRTTSYPRLAVTLAIGLLVASLVVLVYFVHHVAHSIQIDEVMTRVERTTLRVIEQVLPTTDISAEAPEPPVWAVPVPAGRSGYLQTVHAVELLAVAHEQDAVVSVVPMLGEHVIQGEPLVRVWRASPEQPPPRVPSMAGAVRLSLRLGFERTAEQDVAFGVRQLTDVAVKALSPAINDPYTAVQALDHTSVLLCALASRPLGHHLLRDLEGELRVVVRGGDLRYYLDLAIGQIRRYGATEPRVLRALLRALRSTGSFCLDDAGRALVAEQVRLVVEAARSAVVQPEDLEQVTVHAEAVLREVSG